MRISTNVNNFKMSDVHQVINATFYAGGIKHVYDELYYKSHGHMRKLKKDYVTEICSYRELTIYVDYGGVYFNVCAIVTTFSDVYIRSIFNYHGKSFPTYNPKTKESGFITVKEIMLDKLINKL